MPCHMEAAAAAAAAHCLTRRPALLLGMRELKLFKRVAIDFAANRIYFDLPELGS